MLIKKAEGLYGMGLAAHAPPHTFLTSSRSRHANTQHTPFHQNCAGQVLDYIKLTTAKKERAKSSKAAEATAAPIKDPPPAVPVGGAGGWSPEGGLLLGACAGSGLRLQKGVGARWLQPVHGSVAWEVVSSKAAETTLCARGANRPACKSGFPPSPLSSWLEHTSGSFFLRLFVGIAL